MEIVLPLVLALGGVAVGVVGYLGLAERLPRNGFAGVRTPTTMSSDAAFRVANRVAGVPTLVGGVVAVVGAVVAWLVPTGGALVAVVLVTSAGMVLPVVVGAVRGVRAARAIADQEP